MAKAQFKAKVTSFALARQAWDMIGNRTLSTVYDGTLVKITGKNLGHNTRLHRCTTKSEDGTLNDAHSFSIEYKDQEIITFFRPTPLGSEEVQINEPHEHSVPALDRLNYFTPEWVVITRQNWRGESRLWGTLYRDHDPEGNFTDPHTIMLDRHDMFIRTRMGRRDWCATSLSTEQ